MKSIHTLMALAALAAAPSFAQTPPKLMINHFGRLLDGNDNPISGTATLKVTIWKSKDSALPADVVWSDEISIEMKNGFYSVTLGDEQAGLDPLPASVFGDGTVPLWLGIKAGTDAEALPRMPLNLVPWANWANTAGTAQLADDLDCTGCVDAADLASGAIGAAQLAANLPGSVLAAGAIGSTQIASGAVGATQLGASAVGTAAIGDGQITRAKLGADGCTNGQILQFDNGIPGWKCSTLPAGSLYGAATGGGLTLTNTDFSISANGVTSARIADDQITNADLATGAFAKITGVGKLGSLVVGPASAGDATLALTVTGNASQQTYMNFVTKDVNGDGGWATTDKGWHITGRGDAYGNTAENNDLIFWRHLDVAPEWTNTLTLDYPTANVGISTSTPTARLHVKGAAAFTGSGTFSATAATTTISGAPGTTKFASEIDVGDTIVAGGQTRIVATRTSDTAAAVSEAWTAALTNTTFTIQKPPFQVDRANGTILFGTNATGALGIGTATPATPLHVAGSNPTLTVGPYAVTGVANGRISVTGGGAELSLAKRSLNAWPAAPVAGDRFVWYNPDGALRLWTEATGDLWNISSTGIIAQENWVTPTFLNSWVNYGGGYNPAGYFMDKNGIVHLRGLVKNGTSAVIFTLPAAYRPAYQQLHVVMTNPNVAGRCDITTAGNVQMDTGNNGWFSLDGITFRAATPCPTCP